MAKWKGDPGCSIQKKVAGQMVDVRELVEVEEEWKNAAMWKIREKH